MCYINTKINQTIRFNMTVKPHWQRTKLTSVENVNCSSVVTCIVLYTQTRIEILRINQNNVDWNWKYLHKSACIKLK